MAVKDTKWLDQSIRELINEAKAKEHASEQVILDYLDRVLLMLTKLGDEVADQVVDEVADQVVDAVAAKVAGVGYEKKSAKKEPPVSLDVV